MHSRLFTAFDSSLFRILLLTWVAGITHVLAATDPSITPTTNGNSKTTVLTSVQELSLLHVSRVASTGIALIARGLTATGECTELRHELPTSYRRAQKYHHKYLADANDNYWDRCFRLIYRHRNQDFVAGAMVYMTNGEDDPDWYDSFPEIIMNVPWGFDVKTQKFWIHADTDKMVPLPTPLRGQSWAGLRFRMPLPLRRFKPEEAQGLIESRGGAVMDAQGPVDVVLLPDSIQFCPNSWRSHNTEAATWIHKGARVLWERNFPRPMASHDGDEEWSD
jgi:hypothetical protein